MVEEIHLTHLPAELALYVACYKDVRNAPFLKQQLLAGNQEYNYAFIDATTLLSRRHLLTGCFRALNDYIHDRLKSNNVQSEIVFCLSPNNNIGDAFRRFGIQDLSTDLVVIKVGGGQNVSREDVEHHLDRVIEGTKVEFTDKWLAEVGDLDKIRKIYKLAKPQPGRGGKSINGDTGLNVSNDKADIEVQALGLMALRGAT